MPATTKPKTKKKAAPQKRYNKRVEDLTEVELEQEVLNLKPWDTDVDFFHDWCDEMDVHLYQEALTRSLNTQHVVGTAVCIFAATMIAGSFITALLSRI